MKTTRGHAPAGTPALRSTKLAFVLLLSMLAGCATGAPGDSSERRSGLAAPSNPLVVKAETFRNATVINFREERAVKMGDVYICPLTGLSMTPGSVEEGAGEAVADLFRSALAKRGFSVKGPDETGEAVKDALADGGDYTEAFGLSVGRKLEADLVILGVVARYEDRVGGKFSVDKPASVAFSAVVINVAEGKIVWKARYDKAQKDLFSDLLDIRTFVRGGMTWQTAGQLADMGVDDMLERAALRPFVKTGQGY